mgnify:CR=1 FL=1
MEQHLVEQREVSISRKNLHQPCHPHPRVSRSAAPCAPGGLTLEAVRRVLANVEIDQDLVVRLVEELLAEICEGRQPIEVSLSAHDLQLIEGNDEGFRRNFPRSSFASMSHFNPATASCGVVMARLTVAFPPNLKPWSELSDERAARFPASSRTVPPQLGSMKLPEKIGRVAQVTGLVHQIRRSGCGAR